MTMSGMKSKSRGGSAMAFDDEYKNAQESAVIMSRVIEDIHRLLEIRYENDELPWCQFEKALLQAMKLDSVAALPSPVAEDKRKEALQAWLDAYPEGDEDCSIEELWARYGSEFAYAMRLTREAMIVTAPVSPVAEDSRDYLIVSVKNLVAMSSLLPPPPVTIDGKGTFVYQDPQAAERLNKLRSVFDAMMAAAKPVSPVAQSGEHVIYVPNTRLFYRPNAHGYTHDVREAGRWPEDEARKLIAHRKDADVLSFAEAAAMSPVAQSELSDALEALTQAKEYFDNRADVRDGEYYAPEPNREMSLAQLCRDGLAEIEKIMTRKA